MQGSARKDVVFGAARVDTVTVPGLKWKSWLPLIAVFAKTREGDVVPRVLFGSVAPDRGLDATDADFSDEFWVCHDGSPFELRFVSVSAHPERRKRPSLYGRNSAAAPGTGRADNSKSE